MAGCEYLIVSSQGDSTYPVYRIQGDDHVYLGRFAIVDGDVIDGVTQTDGLDAWSGPIGPFPVGALGFHDHEDSPNPGQQNFKMVDWRDVKTALGSLRPEQNKRPGRETGPFHFRLERAKRFRTLDPNLGKVVLYH